MLGVGADDTAPGDCSRALATAHLDLPMLMAAKPNVTMLTITITTWLFAVCGAIGLVQTLRHWPSGIHGFVRWYTLLASLSAVGLALWMWHADLMDVRLWAW
jgi:hypothetical protein